MLSEILKLMTQNNTRNRPAYMTICKLITFLAVLQFLGVRRHHRRFQPIHIRFLLGMRNYKCIKYGINNIVEHIYRLHKWIILTLLCYIEAR